MSQVEEIAITCHRCGKEQTFAKNLEGSSQACDHCGGTLQVMRVVAPTEPYTKKRGLISWLEALGAVVDATTPKYVEEIRFLNGSVVNEHVISSLALLPHLQCVTVLHSEFNDDLVGLLGKAVPHLCDLNLSGGGVTDAGLDHLSGHPLMRLGIPGNRSEGRALRHFPRLREIDLRGNPVLDESLSVLLNLNRPIDFKANGLYTLKRLDLRDTTIGDASVDVLVKLGAANTYINGSLISDDGLLRFGKCHTRWDVLKIHGPNITWLGQSKALVGSQEYTSFWKDKIELGVGVRVSSAEDGLSLYATGEQVTNLDVVNFGWRGFADRFSEIELSSPQLTDMIVSSLVEYGLNDIKKVTLSGTYSADVFKELSGLGDISDLTVISDNITSEDLRSFSGLTGLQRLTIASSQVDDEAVDVLASFDRLQHADLSKSNLSAEALARLNKHLGSN